MGNVEPCHDSDSWILRLGDAPARGLEIANGFRDEITQRARSQTALAHINLNQIADVLQHAFAHGI
jgi:hypothetical protein